MSTHPKPRPIFIAALQREITALVRSKHAGWHTDAGLLSRKIHLYWNEHAVVACAGMGAHRVRFAVEAALALGPATELVSVGFAGACIHRLRVGDVFCPDVVIDAQTGERFLPLKQRGSTEGLEILVTVAAPAGVQEKARLSTSYFASAVDMEAAAVARIAQTRDLPFQAIKAISDDALFEMAQLSYFATGDGQFREAAFGLHVAARPALWKPVAAMARGSKLAAAGLQAEIKAHIQQARKTRS